MEDKIEMDDFSMLNYKAIELLVQLNCLKPSEDLINKAESLLESLSVEDGKAFYVNMD